jgi:hypothetical protein
MINAAIKKITLSHSYIIGNHSGAWSGLLIYSELPVGEFAGQWLWLGKACVFFAVCILFVFTVCPKQPT